MARLNDADKFIYHHCLECPYRIENSCDEDDPICSSVLDLLDFPTVDAVPVAHGRWVGKEGLYQGKCSACGYMTYDKTADWARRYWHYCPNCGAKMDGGAVDD